MEPFIIFFLLDEIVLIVGLAPSSLLESLFPVRVRDELWAPMVSSDSKAKVRERGVATEPFPDLIGDVSILFGVSPVKEE